MRPLTDNFSYTQFSLWNSSPRTFWNRYGLGEEKFDSEEMEKGREFMSYVQHEISYDADPKLPEVAELITRLGVFEAKLTLDVSEKFKFFKSIVSFLDTYDPVNYILGEYKTGRVPWTQEMVDENEQLLFYSAIHYLTEGVIPECFLEWIQTERDEYGNLYYTGNVYRFQTSFDDKQVEDMVKRIFVTISEIEEYEHREAVIAPDLEKQYVELSNTAAKAKAQLDFVKNEIQSKIEEEDALYGAGEDGVFVLISTKTGSKYIKFNPNKNEKL